MFIKYIILRNYIYVSAVDKEKYEIVVGWHWHWHHSRSYYYYYIRELFVSAVCERERYPHWALMRNHVPTAAAPSSLTIHEQEEEE